VDSHQLNKAGDKIKLSNRRYPDLIPNLAFLHSNYWADEGASLAIKNVENNTNQNLFHKPKNLYFPQNDFRFHITYDGVIIDKLLSNFILNVLEKERILRIQRREAQGLMSRMIDHTTCNPRDLARASSHRRYLTNLTSTHTRACYKCKQYLALNIMDKEAQRLEDASDRFFDLLLTKNLLDKNKHILCCPVCEEQMNHNSLSNMKGNRRHFTHFCRNEKILNFRNGVNTWLETLI